jgi:hypothetical protein
LNRVSISFRIAVLSATVWRDVVLLRVRRDYDERHAKLTLHVEGQLIPEGLLVTVPVPVPARLTLNTGELLKVAVTCWLVVSVTAQVGVMPLQPPVHPTKYEFAADCL